jgi:hypothetical protein
MLLSGVSPAFGVPGPVGTPGNAVKVLPESNRELLRLLDIEGTGESCVGRVEGAQGAAGQVLVDAPVVDEIRIAPAPLCAGNGPRIGVAPIFAIVSIEVVAFHRVCYRAQQERHFVRPDDGVGQLARHVAADLDCRKVLLHNYTTYGCFVKFENNARNRHSGAELIHLLLMALLQNEPNFRSLAQRVVDGAISFQVAAPDAQGRRPDHPADPKQKLACRKHGLRIAALVHQCEGPIKYKRLLHRGRMRPESFARSLSPNPSTARPSQSLFRDWLYDRCPPKAFVKPVGAKKELERGPEYKDLRECRSSLHTRKKFA